MQVATWLAAEWRTGTGEGAQTLGADSAEHGCGRNVSAFGPAAHHSHFRAEQDGGYLTSSRLCSLHSPDTHLNADHYSKLQHNT